MKYDSGNEVAARDGWDVGRDTRISRTRRVAATREPPTAENAAEVGPCQRV
jgi:hypothetical protein